MELAQAESDGVRSCRERAANRLLEWRPGWVINCTGPVPSNSVESNPVIGSLLVSGWVQPDELALGIETTPTGNALAEDGREVSDLFVVGTSQARSVGKHRGTGTAQTRQPPSPNPSSGW